MSLSMKRRSGLVALIVAFPLAIGCGGSSGGKVHVSGRVTLDEKPLDAGTITFTRVENDKSQAVGGAIVKGQYSVDNVAPGQNKVLIKGGTKSTGETPPGATNQMEHVKQATQMAQIGRVNHQKAKKMAEAMKGDAGLVSDKTVGNNQIQEITTGSSQTVNISLTSTTGK
jgi:hypothetical protein